MSDAVIDIVGPDSLPVIVKLYNQIFRPVREISGFRRRYLGRHNVLQMIARVDDDPVGFFVGFELKPSIFFTWFYGGGSGISTPGNSFSINGSGS